MHAMIKRLLPAILIPLALCLGCGKKGGEGAETGAVAGNNAEDRIVAASFYPIYIAAMNVTENVPGIRLVSMAANSTGCMHDYQLSSADAALIEKAEVLIVNGGGMEGFLDRAASLNEKLALIDASAGHKDSGDDHRHDSPHENHYDYHHDRHQADNNADDNTHAWMSIENHARQIETIAERLSVWDTANAKAYGENARRYIVELMALKETATLELSGIGDDNRKIAVSHDGFLGLAREFDLTVTAIIEKEHGAEPTAADLAGRISAIKKAKPKALFVDGARPSPPSKTISAETGLPAFELDLIVAGPLEKDAYIRAMERNVAVIKRALE